MRILLVANYVPDGQESMQRYAALLEGMLTKSGHEVRLLRPAVAAGRIAAGAASEKWLGYFDKLVLFPRVLRRSLDWPDIVHILDHSNAFYVKYVKARTCLVTCHDLVAIRSALGEVPGQPTRWSGRMLQSMILRGLSQARNIVCVSDATRTALGRLVSCGDKNVARIYNGPNYPYRPMDQAESAGRLKRLGIGPNQAFVLHVGGNGWHKNRLGVLESFARLRKIASARDLLLVMAGKRWTREMREFVLANGIEMCVIEAADIAEEDLCALYSRAEALLFPSLEEGFGWPIIEAQACGCPVVTSGRAPMTEVGGDAALYVDPTDYESVAAAAAQLMGLRGKLEQQNARNAARFDAARMTEAYVEFYSRLLAENMGSDAFQRWPLRSLLKGFYHSVLGAMPPEVSVYCDFAVRHRKLPQLSRPRTFSEKIQNRKLYERDVRFPRLADKLRAKEYVSSVLGPEWIIPTLWAGPELPSRSARTWDPPYVLKATHGSGQNLFVTRELPIPPEEMEAIAAQWLKSRHGLHFGEWLYGEITPGLLVERYIGADGVLPTDYKFFVFGGRVAFIQVDTGRGQEHRRCFFDRRWRRQPFGLEYPLATEPIDAPESLPAMIQAAELLGSAFDFVRVDLYEVEERPLFGELTFYPGSGRERFSPRSFDEELGKLWLIPEAEAD